MSDFVAECRREWKRLRVPDPVADEMAGELAADLQEAEAEGASAEEVLGSASDPRSFATAWAAARGLIQRPQLPSGWGLLWRSGLTVAIGALFALIAIIGAVLVIPASSSRSRGLDLPTPDLVAAPGPTPSFG
jgi:hypothetical protein